MSAVLALADREAGASAGTPQRELAETLAVELYIVAGRNAIAGWPLPSGLLPVAAGEHMVVMTPREWEAYKRLTEADDVMREAHHGPDDAAR